MSIPKSTVEHVAKLARLELSEEELERYAQDLSKILALVEELNQVEELNTPDSLKTEVGMTLENTAVLREDKAHSRYERDTLLKNAPLEEDGFFRVPRILEES